MDNLNPQLEGNLVRLEPLGREHVEALWGAAQAPEIWRWLAPVGESRELFERWLELTFAAAEAGEEGPFATLDAASGRVIGSTRFLNVRPADRVVEIGWTWLNPSAWGSGANVEAKLLMMEHAFERLDCVRVEFKTDARNERSRAALAALPARFEGVLRNHMIMPGVGQRDSAYYSVVDREWPAVRSRLATRLGSSPTHASESGTSSNVVLRHTTAAADLDALEPLWNALQEHHVEVTPSLGPDGAKRELSEAWRIRRAKYEHWLADSDTFFVVAEADGDPVGYACVTVGPPYASWDSGERLAELETLSVLPGRRGEGIGATLLDAAWTRLGELGVADMQITTTATNFGAKRFYESQGFVHGFDVYYAKRP